MTHTNKRTSNIKNWWRLFDIASCKATWNDCSAL